MSRFTLFHPVVLTALALAAGVAGTAPAAATSCPSLTDPAGDGMAQLLNGTAPQQASAPELDVLSADVASGAHTVVLVLRVDDLDPTLASPQATRGVTYRVGFASGTSGYLATVRTSPGGSPTVIVTEKGVPTTGAVLSFDTTHDEIRVTVPRTSLHTLHAGSTFRSLMADTTAHTAVGVATNADYAVLKQDFYVDQTPGCVPAA